MMGHISALKCWPGEPKLHLPPASNADVYHTSVICCARGPTVADPMMCSAVAAERLEQQREVFPFSVLPHALEVLAAQLTSELAHAGQLARQREELVELAGGGDGLGHIAIAEEDRARRGSARSCWR